MSTEIVEVTTSSNMNLNKCFTWYKNAVSGAVNSASEEFWEAGFEYKLLSISKSPNIVSKNADYFVTNIKFFEDTSSKIKLCQNTIDLFLTKALGNTGEEFEIDNLTELEAQILTAFNRNLYKHLKSLFAPEAKIKTLIKENELTKDCLHFTFLVNSKEQPFGKIIISLPSQALIEPEEIPPVEDALPETIFSNCPIDIDIYVGQTKTSLEDVKMLESGDIIILEKSDISKMKVKGRFDFEFNINPDPMLVYNYQEDEEYEDGEDDMTDTNLNEKNRWDLIHVDMSAEFEKIKMPLGELRQISKGLIIDLAPVYKNKITLKVENNAIATGELVIIDDKYGVLLDEVITEENSEQANQESTATETQSKSTIEDDDDDFDLDDFDIDDELDDDLDDDFDDEDI